MHSLSFTLALLPSANSSLPPTVTVYPRIPSTRVPSAVTPSLSALARTGPGLNSNFLTLI
eukprot:8139966-Pyramimonas_sp.AAC.2